MAIVAIPISGVGSSGGSGVGPPAPGAPSILSVAIIDTLPDSSGNPQKQITVTYTPPSPLGTFNGIDIWLDAPDTAGGLYIADGTMPADGTIGAVGVFAPAYETFFPYSSSSFSTSFIVPAPNTTQLWRVYITAASANTQVPPVQFGLPGASPSFQITVLPPATTASGREYAPNVQNPALNSGIGWPTNPVITVSDSGDQYFSYSIVWTWPTTDPAFPTLGGINIVLQNNTTGTQTYPGDVLVSATGLDNSQPVTVLPGTTSYTVYLLSFDVRGNSNTLVPGVTPQVNFSVTRNLGAAGEEYTQLATSDGVHAFVTAVAAVTASGTQEIEVDGWWEQISQGQAGYDPAFAGCEIVVDKGDGKGPVYSVVKGTLSPIENFILEPATAQTWAFYLRSIDINGKPNSIGPRIVFSGGGGSGAAAAAVVTSGVVTSCTILEPGSGYGSAPTATLVDGQGNAIAGVSLTASISGSAVSGVSVGSGGSNIIATPQAIISVGSSTGVLNLAKAVSTSFSGQFAIVAGAFTVTALNANTITVGTLKVGNNGSGVPIEIDVYDHLGSLIGWIGDDTANSGFVGLWAKQARIGGASPTSAPLVADSSGNIAISGSTVSVSITSTAGSPTTTVIGGGSNGVTTSQGTFTTVLDAGFTNVANGTDITQMDVTFSGSPELIVSTGSGGSSSGLGPQVVVRNSSVIAYLRANQLILNGLQVLESRQTGWSAPTGTFDRNSFATGSVTLVTLAETVAALITDLMTHGLIGA